MKLFGSSWLAASSGRIVTFVLAVLLSASICRAATRPQYGGTLHVSIFEVPMSLDPHDDSQGNSLASRNLLSLMFETLVTVDDRGRAHPGLATEWEAGSANQRWRFTLRRGVRFHDGSALTAEIAASALRMANPSWKVFAEEGAVLIECDRWNENLPAELALSRDSIVKRNGGMLSGTGPFHIGDWQAGKHLSLAVEEGYWRGRPFVDAIEIEMGKNFHEQLNELESGKADLIEISPEQAHRVTMAGRQVSSSQPVELIALVFNRDAQTPDEKLLRSALAHSIDRASMRSVLLQGAGQPSASFLPNWMSGYGFTFSTEVNLNLARHEREQARTAPDWTLGYDANDPLARVLAERIALNARDAGLVVQPTAGVATDLRLVRTPLPSPDPWVALTNIATTLGMTMQKVNGDSVEGLYNAEQTLLAAQRAIPLFHLPAEWASSTAVKDWMPRADGLWRLDEVWMGKEDR